MEMEKKTFEIGGIPALLWGPGAERLILAVHGSHSHKADVPVRLLAECAVPRGYQVLSFDLPQHGERAQGPAPFEQRVCVEELAAVVRYAGKRWLRLSLFGNSLGAWFSLAACRDEPLEQALFLSPVVDMRRLIENMMAWAGVTPQRLRAERKIPTGFGETLCWDEYCYACRHPAGPWRVPTAILYGGKDDLCEQEVVQAFAQRFGCALTTVPWAPHYFHTPQELDALRGWFAEKL
ncbi:alpha/beta hydrolase [Anaerofilum hominis]